MNKQRTSYKPLEPIKEELSELSLDVFSTDRVLRYEYFRIQAFSDVSLSDFEYEITTGRKDLLEELDRRLLTIIEDLAIPEEMTNRPPENEVMERNAVAAKITYKRALYMVRLNKFCEAAQTTAFAAYYLTESSPSLKDNPYLVIRGAHSMAVGLLEETLTSYMAENYTASDCQSSCGYCQDPLSTVAKYCTEVLEDLNAPESKVKEIWTIAAAMLGAYALIRGATLDPMRFPDDFPQQAKVALKMILVHEKTDMKSFMASVARYVEMLRMCRIDFFTHQYEDELIVPWDPYDDFPASGS